MDEDVANRVLDMLEKLGTTLGELAPDVQRIAMQSVHIQIIEYVMYFITLVAIGVVLLYIGVYNVQKVRKSDGYGDTSDNEITAVFGCVFGAGASGLAMVALTQVLQRLVAPEYFAVKNIIELVTGG